MDTRTIANESQTNIVSKPADTKEETGQGGASTEPINTAISIDYASNIDHLQRVAFARKVLRIAQRLDVDNSAAVIGLEAAWGAGKTRVLNGIADAIEELAEDERPILVRFNPWMISGTFNLVEAFLLQMAADIAMKAKTSTLEQAATLADALIDYANLLGVIKHLAPAADLVMPGSGRLLKLIGGAANQFASLLRPTKPALARLKKNSEKLSLTESKKHVEEALTALGKKVIVFVDDLDRLPPEEFIAMLQAVKAVADFPGVVFILAYDAEIASQSIRRILRLSDGKAYLEKIVQVQLPLPEPPASRLQAFAINRLQSAFGPADIPSQSDFNTALPILAAMMETPRDVERLRTRLIIASETLEDKINRADLALLEALSMKAPKIIAWICNNIRVLVDIGNDSRYDETLSTRGLVGEHQSNETSIAQTFEQQLKSRAYEWHKLYPETPDQYPVKYAMAFLFERCKTDYFTKGRSNFRRVQHFKFWYQWRCFHDHHDVWSINDLTQLLLQPKRIIDAGWHADPAIFIQLCDTFLAYGPMSFLEADTKALIDVCQAAEAAIGSDHFAGTNSRAILALMEHAIFLALPFDRQQHLSDLVGKLSPWASGLLIRRFYQRARDGNSGTDQGSLPVRQLGFDSQAPGVRNQWFAKADDILRAANPADFSEGRSPYRLLGWMEALGRNTDTIRKLGEDFLAVGPERLSFFFSNFDDLKDPEANIAQIHWPILNLDQIRKLADQTPVFQTTHGKLLAIIDKAKANQENLLPMMDTNLDKGEQT